MTLRRRAQGLPVPGPVVDRSHVQHDPEQQEDRPGDHDPQHPPAVGLGDGDHPAYAGEESAKEDSQKVRVADTARHRPPKSRGQGERARSGPTIGR